MLGACKAGACAPASRSPAREWFRLAKSPERIGVGEVIRRTEAGFTMVGCFDAQTNTCPLIKKCKLRAALVRATEAFMAELDALTLADIASNGAQLLETLELDAPLGCQAA
jgi:Rrf2 family transcriptional regulator, nitric oxide-sensitive transcriptional repressor